MMRISISILAFLCLTARAQVTNQVPCDFLSVSNALMTAGEGDLIIVDPGSCVWSNRITINRNVSFRFRGSGTNATFFYSNSSLSACLAVQTTSTNTFYISDFTAFGVSANTEGWFLIGGTSSPGTPPEGLVNIYNLSILNNLRYGIVVSLNSRVLVDHVYWNVPPTLNSWNCIRVVGNSYNSWLQTPIFNSHVHGVIVEDCVFENDSGGNGNGFMDGYNGSWSWFRHNIFDGNAANGMHGYDSQITSAQVFIINNNIFTNVGSLLCLNRGGVYHFYSNQIWSANSPGGTQIQPKLAYYRAIALPETLGVQLTKGHVGTPLIKTWTLGTNWVLGAPQSSNDVNVGSYNYVMRTNTSSQNLNNSVFIGDTLLHSLTNLIRAVNGGASNLANYSGISFSRASTNAYPGGRVPCLDMYGVVSNDATYAYLILTNRLDGMIPIEPYSYGNPAAFIQGAYRLHEMYTNNWDIMPCAQWGNTFRFNDGTLGVPVEWQLNFEGFTNEPNDTVNTLVEGVYWTNAPAGAGYGEMPYPQNPRSPASGNSPPTISQIANQTIPHSTSTGPLAFTVGDAQDGPNALAPVGGSSDTNLVPVANIVFSGSGSNRFVDITPTPGIGGEATISISVTDSAGVMTTMQFTLTVNPPVINTPPTLSQIDDQVAYKSTTIGPLAFLADDEQVGGSLTILAWSNNQGLVPDSGILIGGEGTNRNLTILPSEGWSGVARIYYSASDGVFTVTNNFQVTFIPDSSSPSFVRRIRR